MRRDVWWSARAASLAVGSLLLLSACTGDGDDEQDTEVAGAALERDAEDRPSALDDPDDERVDPREPADASVDEEAAGEDGDDAGSDDAGSDDTGGSDDAADDADATDTTDAGSEADAAGTGGDGDDGSGGSAPSSEEAGGDPPADDTPDEPAPDPPAPPEPERLAAGAGHRGDAIGFGPDGTELLVSGPLESPPAVGARSDAVRAADADRMHCRTWLQAPQDRGLLAQGDLTVSLLIETHDGEARRVPRTVMDLDVELAAGERFELPETSPYDFDRDEAASIACEAEFAPR